MEGLKKRSPGIVIELIPVKVMEPSKAFCYIGGYRINGRYKLIAYHLLFCLPVKLLINTPGIF